MEKEYGKYCYEGPIVLFDKCVANGWKGETLAPNERKARSNLIYQAKKAMNLIPSTKISLPGAIKLIS